MTGFLCAESVTRCVVQCPGCRRISATPTKSRHLLPEHRDVTRLLAWAHDTFPDVQPGTQVRKVLEEARELAAAPLDAEEMADVLITVLFLASLSGVDLRSAFRDKVTKNINREWVANSDGTYSHRKEIHSEKEEHEGQDPEGSGDVGEPGAARSLPPQGS